MCSLKGPALVGLRLVLLEEASNSECELSHCKQLTPEDLVRRQEIPKEE